MLLKKVSLFTIAIMLISCSNLQERRVVLERMPAEDANCQDLAKSLFMKDNFKADLNQSLVDKKLLKFSNKFVTVQHPRMDWINRTRASLNRSLKNWNNNKYPAFYIFSDDDVLTEAKRYFETINSIVTHDITPAPEASKNLELVSSWMKTFENYKKEVDDLLDERISLQYNLKVLKKFKQVEDIQDIKLVIKRNGEFKEEIITLRKSDKDKNFQIARLKAEIKALDGTILKNGKIKDRIIQQAALNDILTITQREFEYGIKNTDAPSPELTLELEKMNALLSRIELKPTTYGVYRITNKIFIREIVSATKVDWVYKNFIKTPALKFKEIFDAFIKKKTADADKEKIGIFKRIYSKVTSITPKQWAIGTGSVVVAGVGYERYFSLKSDPIIFEEKDGLEVEEFDETKQETVDDKKHKEQLERTKKENTKKADEYSEVIEIHLDELVN
jgi:hypothetical protein